MQVAMVELRLSGEGGGGCQSEEDDFTHDIYP
jgi:hypothetical protein